ncbi:MAG: HEAT repeat domain-containing protein [Colwellia sp.]|nr:HEAT repeat domain-containing protein [Colwellia sp.]
MHSKYVYAVIIFTLGVLIGRVSVDFLTTNNDITQTKKTLDAVVQETLFSKKTDRLVEKNASASSGINAASIAPPNEHLRVIPIEGSSLPENDWQRILYETDDLELKIAAINNLVSDDATEELAIGLGDTSAYIRQKTLIGLGTINTENSIRMVGQTLFSDRSIENRLQAISILENNFDMPFVEHLLTFTMKHDQDATVRQRAAISLGL